MSAFTKTAPIAAILLILIVVIVVLLGGPSSEQDKPVAVSQGVGAGATQSANSTAAPVIPQQSPIPGQQTAPGQQQGQDQSAAPMLGNLVTGLEAKVKADPENINNKLLLAQTYAELGRLNDGIKLLDGIPQDAGGDARVPLVTSMVYGKSDDPAHLKKALALLGDLESVDPARKGQIMLHKGKLLAKMGDNAAAKSTWEEGMKQLPESDPLRQEFEKELGKI